MASKLHKIFTGAAVLSVGLTACIGTAPAAMAGSVPLNGVYGWGENATGSLGTGTSAITKTPSLSATSLINIDNAATSSTHTLFLDREGNVFASGSNANGQLGNGTTTNATQPVKVKLPLRFGVPDYATQIWASEGVSFMRGSYGDLYSWGSNDKGLTGLGKTTGNTLVPTKVNGVALFNGEKGKLAISSTAVVVMNDGWADTPQLFTWGDNNRGILGRAGVTAPIVSSPQRVLISDPDEDLYKDVDKCSIVKDPDSGETTEECISVTVPKTYDELVGLSPDHVAVGKNFFAVVSDNTVYTWGVNDKGQLGMALPQNTVLSAPTTSDALKLENYAYASSISAGENHVILLGDDGLVYGWGDNSKSQVAPYYSGSNNQSFLNVLQRLTILKAVADSSSWEYVATGDDTSYGVTSDNSAYGWGDNTTGEIANTKETIIKSPSRITFPYETSISTFVAGGNNAVAVSDYIVEYDNIEIPENSGVLPAPSSYTDYSYTLKSVKGYPGNSHKWTIYGLPTGLSYDSKTGRIFGKATKVGSFNIEAMVTDNVDEATYSYTMEVAKAAPTVGVTYSNVSPGVTRATINVAANGTNATGTATLTYGSATKVATLTNGKATIDFAGTANSKVNASVKYSGSSTLTSSVSSVQAVTITPKYAPTVTATYKSYNPGQITTTINVARGTTKGTGVVTLQYGSVKKTANLVNGTATITVAATAGAKYTVSTSYAGSWAFNAGSTKATSITTMKKRTASVSPIYTSTRPGQITSTVTVKDGKGYGTGSVTFYVGTVKKTATLSKGKAVITLSASAGKKHTVKTVYSGSTNLNAQTTAAKSVTAKAKYSSKPSVKFSVATGRKVTATVTVATQGGLAPTGTVYLYDGSKKIKTLALSKGAAKVAFVATKGTHKYKVVYAGNTYFNAYTSNTSSVVVR